VIRGCGFACDWPTHLILAVFCFAATMNGINVRMIDSTTNCPRRRSSRNQTKLGRSQDVLIETACARVRRPETLSRVLGLGAQGVVKRGWTGRGLSGDFTDQTRSKI